MINEEIFDQRVERFLKKQMSPEEEKDFKDELAKEPNQLARAKSIALAINSLKSNNKISDKDIQNMIKETDNAFLQSITNGTYYEEFDIKVERFIKKQMTDKEEKDFLDLLKSSADLERRAKVLALSIQHFRNSQKEKDKEITKAIGNTDIKRFKHLIGIKPHIIPFFRTISIAASVAIIFGIGIHSYHVNEIQELGSSYKIMAYRSTTSGDLDNEIMSISKLIKNSDSLSLAQDRISELDKRYMVQGIVAQKYNTEGQTLASLKWNLAIAYLKEGKGINAKKILQDITFHYAGLPIAEKAKKLIDEIEKIYWF